MKDEKGDERRQLERMARAVISNKEEYTREERERVRETLERHPADLRRVLEEIHGSRGEGGER